MDAVKKIGSEEWLSPERLAEEFGIPLRTTYKWRARNYGPPALRIGKHLRYRRRDVERWIEDQIRVQRSVK